MLEVKNCKLTMCYHRHHPEKLKPEAHLQICKVVHKGIDNNLYTLHIIYSMTRETSVFPQLL